MITQEDLNRAAERLSDKIKKLPADDPLLKRLEAGTTEFMRSRGFDIGTFAGCKAALAWLETARVEDAFAEGPEKIDNPADWYLGEARLDGMKTILRARLAAFRS